MWSIMTYQKFNYETFADVQKQAEAVGVQFHYSDSPAMLAAQARVHHVSVPNRIVVQPMEGCNANPDGSPGELTQRRYLRFANSGAGIIWAEATAVTPDCRSSNGQLYLTEKNADAYARLLDQIRESAMRTHGFAPLIVSQLTHSGRYVKTNNTPTPVIAQHNAWIEKEHPLPDSCVISDDRLKYYEEQFGKGAALAKKVGFDGVDIKCAHFYLASELLSAYERSGEYGGCFENRTRFIRNCLRAAKPAADQNFFLTSRINACDGFPYPWGFGVEKDEGIREDYTQVNALIGVLKQEAELPIVNITVGNPYFNPYVNRPYDFGPVEPQEHPFVGVSRMLEAAAAVKQAHPELLVVCSGLSYMREFGGRIAAAEIAAGRFDFAGFGRLALAAPDFADKLLHDTLARRECCVTCTNCSNLMRMFRPAGCIVHDRTLYKKP